MNKLRQVLTLPLTYQHGVIQMTLPRLYGILLSLLSKIRDQPSIFIIGRSGEARSI